MADGRGRRRRTRSSAPSIALVFAWRRQWRRFLERTRFTQRDPQSSGRQHRARETARSERWQGGHHQSATQMGSARRQCVAPQRHTAVGRFPFEGIIKAQLKWEAPDGSVPLRSVQTFRVHEGPPSERVIDFDVTLTAGDKEVILGDTKEGTMAIRIAESMRLAQPKKQAGQGRIANDQGIENGKVWGQRARWVDMSGPVDGRVLGIAMFDHPQNPKHPTRWHARDYGLFAANPFCEYDMDKTQPRGAGAFKIGAGQSATFRYRIYIHEGDEK